MRQLRAWALRCRNLLRKRNLERDFQDELESNLQMEIDQCVRSGMTPEEARRHVLMKFGSLDSVKEAWRDRGGVPFIETVVKDIRYGLRSLLQNKGWASVAVLSLTLGIGVNTALFSLINSLLLRPLPVQNPGELVSLRWYGETNLSTGRTGYGYVAPDALPGSSGTHSGDATFSFGVFEELRAHARPFAELFAVANTGSVNLFANGQAELASAEVVSGNFHRALGVTAFRGRLIEPDDDSASADPVAVISFQYWQRRFGMDPTIVGRLVTINTVPFTIVGITPPGLGTVVRNSIAREVTMPLAMQSRIQRRSRSMEPANWWLMVMGRLKPNVRREQLQAALAGVYESSVREEWKAAVAAFSPERRMSQEFGQRQERVAQLHVVAGARGTYDVDPPVLNMLKLLSGLAGMVLLLVCVNLANLLLSRGASRQREIVVRLAIGASRSRVVRQLLTESFLLAAIGGSLGFLLAYCGRTLLPVWMGFRPVELDWTVLSFAIAVTVLVSIVFGLFPAFRCTAVAFARPIQGSSQFSRAGKGLGSSLVIAQVAISLVLVIGAGLFLRTLRNLRNVDAGFNTHNLILFGVNPAANQYDQARTAALFENILQRLKGIPGVRSAALSSTALLTGDNSTERFGVEGFNDRVISYVLSIREGYFDTIGIPLKLGRDFTTADNQSALRVAIINEEFARRFFPNMNPLGKHVESGTAPNNVRPEIVGVVADARFARLRDDPPPTVYMPHLQQPTGRYFAVRTHVDPAALVPAVRDLMHEIDPNLPLQFISTQTETINELLTLERAFAVTSSLFSILALLISMIGLFGLMSYTVARRTKEIGIRMALGAQRNAVLRSVIREALILVVAGVPIGVVAGAFWLNRFAASQLFGLKPNDPVNIAWAVIVMIAVATIAGYLPARRASRVDPMNALRYE
jgi:predicted permease